MKKEQKKQMKAQGKRKFIQIKLIFYTFADRAFDWLAALIDEDMQYDVYLVCVGQPLLLKPKL